MPEKLEKRVEDLEKEIAELKWKWGIYPPYRVGGFPTTLKEINPHITYTETTNATAAVPQNRVEVYYG